MIGSAIQFYGASQVIQAAQNRKCPGWAVFQNRQFLFKFEENDVDASLNMLQQTLECLQVSTALYTIKFFEHEGNKLLKIKENTQCDGSFNFRLVEEDERQQRNEMYRSGSNKVLEKLQIIEDRLLQIENGTVEVEEEDNTLQGQIVGMLKEPARLTEFINALSSAKSLLGIGPAAPSYVGNINRAGQIPAMAPPGGEDPQQNLSIEEQQRLGIALNTLLSYDPKIVDHMEKLAAMASANTDQFKFLLSMLEMQKP